MALPQRKEVEEELLDPTAVARAYRRERVRRRMREQRALDRRLAAFRFWLVIFTVVAGSIGLAIVIWHQIHRLFGL